MSSSSWRRFVARLTAGALAVAAPVVLAPVAASAAAPTDLFFSEYVEGTSNNKAVEIHNGTAMAVDLVAGAYVVQVYANGAASPTSTIALTGSVPVGDVRVIANSQAGAVVLGRAQQTSGALSFNGNDAVVLRKGGSAGPIIDSIGQVGLDPGAEWGTGLASTMDNTLRRKTAVTSGDTTVNDAFDPSTEWEGFATDSFDALGAHPGLPADLAPLVGTLAPTSGSTGAVNIRPVVTFTEAVTAPAGAFTLTCSTSGAVPLTAVSSNEARTYTLEPASALTVGESCTVTVTASLVTDEDANDPPDAMAADRTSTFTVVDLCAVTATAIPVIQGSGGSATTTGVRTVKGVVVGDYEGTGGLRGFYLQEQVGDGNPATSDAIFVFDGGGSDDVALGDVVAVRGPVSEFEGQTQISTSGDLAVCGSGAAVPATDVTLPMANASAFERYEGMLVRMPQELTVTEHFQLGRFGEVLVSSGGRLVQPTNVLPAGDDAAALQAANALNQILVDDASNRQNPDPIVFGRGGEPLTASNTLRGGDTITGVTGVMTYTWGGASASPNAYRVRPVSALGGQWEFTAANERPSAPGGVGGDVRVAAMNLLNYFNTFDGLPDRQDLCRLGVDGNLTDCRGADTAPEFQRQWPKTVAAIREVDADVLGINEVENDGYGGESAIQDLVDRLNAELGAGTYASIDADARTGQTNALGTDAIKVGMLYQPARVTPVGRTAVLDTPEFIGGGDSAPRSRPSLAQAFRVNATGGTFVADVNHLKSKGSACTVPDAGDGQGSCNASRTVSARALATWLAGDPTMTGERDVVILGDLNSYAKEDPILALEAAGYTNLVDRFLGRDAYSYVFDGQWGYLDHALGSADLVAKGQVSGVAEYHVNADEPAVLDYNLDFKTPALQGTLYAPDEFRVSDHDPVLVGLRPNSPALVNAGFEESSVACGTANAGLTVDITDRDADDTHTVTIAWGDGSSETFDPASASFSRTHTYAAAGRYTAEITVTDSHGHVTTTTSDLAVLFATRGVNAPFQDGTLTAERGSTVPVKVDLTDCDGSEPTDLEVTVEVIRDGGTVRTGTMAHVDGTWLYELTTKGMALGTHTVRVTVAETGQTVTATLGVRG
jgi:predicted extracellular nuclease